MSSNELKTLLLNVCLPSDYEFRILKPFYLFKQTNEMGRQSLRGFPAPEITWCGDFFVSSPAIKGLTETPAKVGPKIWKRIC